MNDRVMAKSLLQGADGRTAPSPVVGEAKALPPEAQLRMIMSADGWKLFQGFLQWAFVWENTMYGQPTEFNEDSRAVMLAPFTLFGVDSVTAMVYWDKVMPAFHNEYAQYRGDELYAKANPMPWIVIKSFVPALAFEHKGPDGQVQAWKLIAELKANETIPFDERSHSERSQERPAGGVQEQQVGAGSTQRHAIPQPSTGGAPRVHGDRNPSGGRTSLNRVGNR